MIPRSLIVIGASAGGFHALSQLLGQFNSRTDTAVCIVLHLPSSGSNQFLVRRLQPFSTLACELAVDDTAIQAGVIYIAPPNRHLLVKDGRLVLGHGPEENRWRPSIDVLFRSAAVEFDGHCIGIVLSGLLDDGSAGMLAIRRAGGCCIVQDPDEAEYPDMPLSVISTLKPDYCVPLAEMGRVLDLFIAQEAPINKSAIPADLKAEADISEKVSTSINEVSKISEQSIFSCPDCGGGLWSIIHGEKKRYRCHIGHAFSERDLAARQSDQLEGTLWVAVRIMEERRKLLEKIGADAVGRNSNKLASDYDNRVQQLQHHIDTLKSLLFDTQTNNSTLASP